MKYTELKTSHQKELNAFPMAFAFSNEQFKKGLEKLGVEKEDILSIAGGGFIRKSDDKAFSALFIRHDTAMIEAFKDDAFLTDAIRYELGNHEFCITYNPDDALDALGLSLDDERTAECFKAARKQYLEHSEY